MPQDEMRRMEAEQELRALARDLLEDFPPFDPSSEFHGGYVDPDELIAYLRDWGAQARETLDAGEG